MIKRSAVTKLTIYRRHAGKCPHKSESRLLDVCECPLWIHGKLRGKFIRKALETCSAASAMMKRDAMIARGGDEPTPGSGLHVVPIAPTGDLSIEHAIQDFCTSKAGKASSTTTLYTRAVRHFQQFCEACEPPVLLLKDIDKTHVQQYLKAYGEDNNRTTVQGRLTHLRVWFNYCVRERRWLTLSPAASRDLNLSKKGKTAKAAEVREPLTPAQITKVIAAIDQLPAADRARARALVLLLLYTGMRISDATFIEREYIDAEQNLQYWIIKTHKLLPAMFWLHDKAVEALNALPKTRVYFFQPDRDDDYRDARFALRNDGKFDEAMPDYTPRVRETTALVVKVLRLAGITTGACHRFRDTFAINILIGGRGEADIYTVCEFLGHSDVRITKDHYLKLIPEYAKRIAQKTRVLDYQFPLAG